MKLFKTLLTIFTVTLMFMGEESLAQTAGQSKPRGEIIGEFQVAGLDYYRGLQMTLFYVSAREASIRTAGARPRVRQVLKVEGPFDIVGNGTRISIPDTIVQRQGVIACNYVLVVVHSPYLDKAGIRNLDGSIPEGQNGLDTSLTDDRSPFNHKDFFSIQKIDLTGDNKSTKVITLKPNLIN